MAFNAMEHFMGWVMQFRQPAQEEEITPDEYESRSR